MDARHRRRLAPLLAVTLAAAVTLAGPVDGAQLLPPLRQALRLATSLVRAPAPPPRAPASITTGVRG